MRGSGWALVAFSWCHHGGSHFGGGSTGGDTDTDVPCVAPTGTGQLTVILGGDPGAEADEIDFPVTIERCGEPARQERMTTPTATWEVWDGPVTVRVADGYWAWSHSGTGGAQYAGCVGEAHGVVPLGARTVVTLPSTCELAGMD